MNRNWSKLISLMLIAIILMIMPADAFAYDKLTGNMPAGYESPDYMALVTLPDKTASSESLVLDGTQSGWAEAELIDAYNYGLTYPDIMGKFLKPITREEFCTIVVKLYENLTGKKAEAGTDPFDDTDNPEILKAYNLKIVNGTAQDEFSPFNNITRQEICVMIFRALNVSIASLDKSEPEKFPFSDAKKIASWAIDAMKFAYKNEIMKGTGNNEISPINNTTREQAIVLLKRTYVKYSGAEGVGETGEIKATVPVQPGNPPMTSEHKKFKQMETGKNLAFPDYDERIELFVSSSEEKPSSLPVSSQNDSHKKKLDLSNLSGSLSFTPIKTIDLTKDFSKDLSDGLSNLQLVDDKSAYTRSSYSAFIDENGNKKRWFAYKLKNALGAKKVIWQVSKSPFNGFADNWKTPIGLVGSGEVTASKGEFQIDFGHLKISSSSGLLYNSSLIVNLASAKKQIPQKQSVYYVRAVPVDSAGNAIGEPGEGMAVIYGEKFPAGDPRAAIEPGFELWTPVGSGYGYHIDHVPYDPPVHDLTIGVDPRSNDCHLFHFHDLEDSYKQIVIQVSTKPFSAFGGGWPDTPNLIYEKSYDLPTTTYADAGAFAYFDDDQYPATVPAVFSEFAKSASEMEEGEYIKYYVRGAAIKQSIEPGKYDVIYSDTITVEYGYSSFQYFSDSAYKKTEKLSVATPSIRIKSYTPVDWQDPDYMHHYYVFRAPAADEITCKWKNVQSGEVLYPYIYPYTDNYYKPRGINSKAAYETIAIPRVLPVNATVYFPPPVEEDKAWYEELFDGIVGFFKDLWKAVQTIVNQVSAAYNNLKTGVTNFVVDLCPVPSLKNEFKMALEAMVTYGMASIGIPPTLPNFDQLSEMSLDYLAEVALTEAGVAPNYFTDQVLDEVSGAIQNEIEKAVNYADANPVNAAFLKLDPQFLYRPAYLEVEIYNNTDVPTVAGSFDVNVTFEMDYWDQTSTQYNPAGGVNLVTEGNYVGGSAPALAVYNDYFNHFWFGLNGYTLDYAHRADVAVYDVFEPRIGIKVPALSKRESRTVRVYMEPFVNKSSFTRYPGGEYVSKLDFENMYYYNGNREFTHFTIYGHYPTAREYMINQGMLLTDPEVEYVYAGGYPGGGTYKKVQKPVNSTWSD